MEDVKRTFENYPEISFIEDLTLEKLKSQMINDYYDKYEEETGKRIELGLADPSRLILYAAALQIYQGMQYIDNAGKQSFLKYAYASFLDNLGALKGITRNEGSSASAMERFAVSEPQKSVITIPMGTRVTAGDNVYFYTTEDGEIPAGESYTDLPVKCADVGVKANGYEEGVINILVDPIGYVGAVVNVTKSEGGAETESDEKLAERIYLAPSRYSTAGPDEAYIYWVKTCNAGIADVKVTSPTAGIVEIRFIMADGTVPGEALIEEVQQYLQDEKIRPLTDKVEVRAPEVMKYEIDIKYYISESDKNRTPSIKSNVLSSVEVFEAWQKEKIGRDINPSYLTHLLMEAGTKRVVIHSPEFAVIPDTGIGICTKKTITYGGVERD